MGKIKTFMRAVWLNEHVSLMSLIVFQVLLYMISIFSGQVTRYKRLMDGVYRCFTDPAAKFAIIYLLLFVVTEILLYIILRHLGMYKPMGIIAPVFILTSMSQLVITYTNSISASMHQMGYILAGAWIGFMFAVFYAKWAANVTIREKTLRKMFWLAWMLCGMNLIYFVAGACRGTLINGAGGNVVIGPISFIPGEILKLFLLLLSVLSFQYVKLNVYIKKKFYILMISSVLVLVIINDTGNAIILALILILTVFMMEGFKWFAAIIGAFSSLSIFGYMLLKRLSMVSDFVNRYFAHIQSRFENQNTLVDISANANLRRALLSVLSHGVKGSGMKNYTYASLNYAAASDFFFDTAISVFGFAGAIIIVLSLAFLISESCRRYKETGNSFCTFSFCNMLTSIIFVQSMIHCLGILNVIPMTGVTLPFMSLGGNSMLVSFMVIGLANGARIDDKFIFRFEKIKNVNVKSFLKSMRFGRRRRYEHH